MNRIEELAEQERIRDTVRSGYAAVAAEAEGSCCGPTCCGGQVDTAEALAKAIGYGDDELSAIPDGANMGLSCGNPVALAGLREGEVVLDLGAGGGFDVFNAGRRVGPSGRAIGVDMTPGMVRRARANTAKYIERNGFDNVEFRLGEIENIPAADASVDAVISNCVINLSPDKPRVYAEIARILRPGGRISVSDIVLKRPLPREVAEDAEALVGCVAGALLLDDLRAIIAANGLVDARFEEKPEYVRAMVDSKDHIAKRVMELIPEGDSIGDYIASMDISARKPDAPRRCC